MTFVISEHPQPVDLSHNKARHLAEPVVLMFAPGCLIGCVEHRRGEDKMLMSEGPFGAPIPAKEGHLTDGGLGRHHGVKLSVLRNYSSIEQAIEYSFDEQDE